MQISCPFVVQAQITIVISLHTGESQKKSRDESLDVYESLASKMRSNLETAVNTSQHKSRQEKSVGIFCSLVPRTIDFEKQLTIDSKRLWLVLAHGACF